MSLGRIRESRTQSQIFRMAHSAQRPHETYLLYERSSKVSKVMLDLYLDAAKVQDMQWSRAHVPTVLHT